MKSIGGCGRGCHARENAYLLVVLAAVWRDLLAGQGGAGSSLNLGQLAGNMGC